MTTSSDHKLGLSLDPQALQALRRDVRGAPDAALRGAAKQFEALFLNMMLKSMRETVPQDGALDSEQTRMFTGMLDQQYAAQLSEGHGMGLADMIVRQLGSSARGRRANAASADPVGGATVATGGTLPRGAGGAAQGVALASAAAAGLAGALGTVDSDAAAGLSASGGPLDPLEADASLAAEEAAVEGGAGPRAVARRTGHARAVSGFRAEMSEAAGAASAASGIPADFMIAQAGLESGWGRHQPSTADGAPSHNLFGIKAGPNWHGAVATAVTTEYVDGVPRRVQQDFRAYGSYAEAFQDYAALLSGNARYARALTAGSAQEFAGALQKAGYATDPDYAGKVSRAIRQVGDLRA